jgi:glycosyltransferase involved in cell wall biosynthesis
MATVDIAIPSYCYGHFLHECVKSILSQSMNDVRILIIDDASPDGSGEIARALAASDPRIEASIHPENRGPTATYNEGIAWAKAPFFLLLSADDYLAPFALERAVRLMMAEPDVVMTYGACVELSNGQPVPQFDSIAADPQWRLLPGRDFVEQNCDGIRNLVPSPTAIVRTATQKMIGGYRACLPHACDMEMWLRFAAYGRVAQTPLAQAVYRVHGANMSAAYYKSIIRDYKQRLDVFDIFFANDGKRFSDARDLHALAKRRLGAAAFWTGVAQWCRGDRATGAKVLRFGLTLNPRMSALPPFGHLLRLERPGSKLRSIAAQALHARERTGGDAFG